MASLIPSILPMDPHLQILAVGVGILIIIGIVFATTLRAPQKDEEQPNAFLSLLQFIYACFLKPHDGDGAGGQQAALESFYKAQANVYDSTRRSLLRGREDMLALVAAQLTQNQKQRKADQKLIWVDIGGGTGYNIEAMSAYLPVADFFSSVYLVDFSPSLCEVARKRFARLGWNNVKVVCQDARLFRLEEHEADLSSAVAEKAPIYGYFSDEEPTVGGADLITMSYSLSMIPDFYSVIDSLSNLLAPTGLIGVIDFYVQSNVDLSSRNYTGGGLYRHVNWFGRLFWRAWFDVDRVSLEAGRRDYLEYRFGTVLGANSRNYLLGAIPYYVWLGRQKKPTSSIESQEAGHEIVERLDAAVTESPYLHPVNHTKALSKRVEQSANGMRSKAFDAAIINLSANLPLPSFFYQNHHWRIHYDDQLKKHTQFKDEYIYTFTWEDSRVDDRLLKLGADDVVLAITSAGDNILSYALNSPARIHAVDLNPSQNHLLELKVASFVALSYEDHWKLFGLGKHDNFRELLFTKLSPHLSSRAFQYWLKNSNVFASRSGGGLYATGGSRHAIRLFRILSTLFGLGSETKALLSAKTLAEQREVYHRRLRPILMSKTLSNLVISHESFLWSALGVPQNQLAMLVTDHEAEAAASKDTNPGKKSAVLQYLAGTLDPVVNSTLIGTDNPYYLLPLVGEYTPVCHAAYLSSSAHRTLSRPDRFDGLRIHTDEISHVLQRFAPGTLTVAVLMDSMDWFDPTGEEAMKQVERLNRAMKIGGRVLIRSAGLKPWYISIFEAKGFVVKKVADRAGGKFVDRVNMYASCFLLGKVSNVEKDSASPTEFRSRSTSADLEILEI